MSLGCAKNLVDSESIAGLLSQDGLIGTANPEDAEILIVNTCGFIQPAIDESIAELRNLAENKQPGQLLIAAGCLTERFRQNVAKEVSGLDGIIGTRRWMDILELVHDLRKNPKQPRYHLPDTATIGTDEKGIVRAALQGNSAYLKIADGCRRSCAYCAIPLIKGTQVSRPEARIIEEAQLLQDAGTQELILISQDTTDYGYDLKVKDGLAKLLEKLAPTVPDIPWIRLLYAYPGIVTDRLINVMASHKNILPYLDIPLQHAHPEILKSMRRPSNIDWVYTTIDKMRTAMPNLAIRTTFIVGYPGETEKEFLSLLDFIETMKFDHVGAFAYFQEQGTPAAPLGDPISEEEKQERLSRLMALQQDISLQKNQLLIGKTLDVFIEGYNEGISVGRSYRDAPEIDGMVFVEGEAEIGSIISAQITDAMVHDLVAIPK